MIWEHTSLFQVLLKHGCNIEARGLYNFTPLTTAAHHSSVAVLDELIYQGAVINDNNNIDKKSPLIAAAGAEKNTQKCLNKLLIAGADVRLRDELGHNTLDAAILPRWADQTCVNLLYAAGCECNSQEYTEEKYEKLIEMIKDDQQTDLPLTSLCRNKIRSHLLSAAGGRHNNLFLAIPFLPLPTRIKDFLLFFHRVHEYSKIFKQNTLQ